MRALRSAAAVIVCIVAVGILSVPVRAVVNSLVQERMESLQEEEVARITNQIQEQQTEANSFTREYTEGKRSAEENSMQSISTVFFRQAS